jgi:hypothetical protein
MSSSSGNLLSLGTEDRKKVVVEGVTHDNKSIRIEEIYVNMLKLSPFSRRNLVDRKGPIEYENSRTTNLQIGVQLLQKRDENKLLTFLTDWVNEEIVEVQDEMIKRALKFLIKKTFDWFSYAMRHF